MIQDYLNAEPQRGSAEVEAVPPNRSLRWIRVVHLAHILIYHGPGDGVVLGRSAIVDVCLEGG